MPAEQQTSEACRWSLCEGLAELRVASLAGAVRPGQSDEGLGRLTWQGAEAHGRLFAASHPAGTLGAPVESYVRGADLVSVYPPSDRFPFRTTLAWSGFAGSVATRVVLTVSLQTDLLDTQPELRLSTELGVTPRQGAGGVWEVDRGPKRTVAVAVHPTDARDASFDCEAASCTLRLTPPFLEKGVIRRFRVAAFFLGPDADPAQMKEAIAAFAAGPPPLTA